MCDNKQLPSPAFGHVIKRMHHDFNRCFEAACVGIGADEATQMNGWILAYLHHNRGGDVYQKDIEAIFGVNRSTVTSIVKLMEKKGYIRRETVPSDARLKKLVLTPLGEEVNIKTKQTLDALEVQMRQGLTPEEIELFFALSAKIRRNLGERDECIK